MGEAKRSYVDALVRKLTAERSGRRRYLLVLSLAFAYGLGAVAFWRHTVELSPAAERLLAAVSGLLFELARPFVFLAVSAAAFHLLSAPFASKGNAATTATSLLPGFVPLLSVSLLEIGYYLSPLHATPPGDRGLDALALYLRAPAAESPVLAAAAAVALFWAIFSWTFAVSEVRGVTVPKSAAVVGLPVATLLFVGFP
ncbi:hypothetical protein [Halegenticoccus soli]|uniref:hypothetical protein n=1 Tax=Halegenticoccus soli TaxID=1985678 RepID=UPI000C6C9642|nr:hypothetical protein [Halegenticoccus soli]